jgi:hypothetical protein
MNDHQDTPTRFPQDMHAMLGPPGASKSLRHRSTARWLQYGHVTTDFTLNFQLQPRAAFGASICKRSLGGYAPESAHLQELQFAHLRRRLDDYAGLY